ncbi:MAG: bifunctional phosphoribosylaminoimidazolecarboxamide formyltransferase/IMP cyclohydrolase [Candidatus Hodarchaeota archaeon]
MKRNLGLISIFDKTGIINFCKKVSSRFSFISTGKTAEILAAANISVKSVVSHTGYPEILGGRVKTLHPEILGGILGTIDYSSEMEEMGIRPLGLVVVNLYPFHQVISQPHVLAEAIENIDIGGVTLLRAAAKNFREVLVICSPDDYRSVGDAIVDDTITLGLRKELAKKAFLYTAKYDALISEYFIEITDDFFPPAFILSFENPQNLRYGENWHQDARYYLQSNKNPFYKQLHGKKVSLNNLVDFYTAIGLFSEHEEPACAIIKHTSPCGFACAEDIETAFDQAVATDELSAFGSAMGFNQSITENLANKLNAMFVDAIIAPQYEEKAYEILTRKEKIVLCKFEKYLMPQYSVWLVANGILVQSIDKHVINEGDLKVVSQRRPTPQDVNDLLFAWKVVKYVKSNAAVVSVGRTTLGIGMGQPSRIEAVKLALSRADDRSQGAVLASDSFFPFRDSIDAAGEKGIRAIIASGGSIRDRESIEAADEFDIAMVWTGIRCFRH